MVEVYIDGAAKGNPGLSGAGIYIKGTNIQEKYFFPLSVMDNHEAEFAALVKGLMICLEKGYKIVSFRTDSQAVEQAVLKRYAKNQRYNSHLQEALKLIDQLDLFFIKWIPEKQNKTADELAKKALQHQKGIDHEGTTSG
ncbi:reverse transcriptase-like protein [Aeribacillus sp. FSL K6-1121]|uniref:reverse transcriptase-like protein n=1 Tax=Aeribacillus sp. FSL K6-1121 TaxID=2954745 RepID=UPI0030F57D7D